MNNILLRRRNKIIVDNQIGDELPLSYIGTALKNIENLGYTFSENLIYSLRLLGIESFTKLYLEIEKNLKAMVGANVVYEPMYPNFPKQVMEMSEAKLYFNAMLQYIGDLVNMRILPSCEKEERFPLIDNYDLKVIDLGTEQEFKNIFTLLMESKSSLSVQDRGDIEWFIKNRVDGLRIPELIPYKENLTYLTGLFLKYGKETDTLLPCFKTSTDVLRLITSMSDGDISLATNTDYYKFARKERRFFLNILEHCATITEDMLRYKNKWIRIGEILHPFEYKIRYPKCAEAFDIIRNNKSFITFNHKIEKLLIERKALDAAKMLQKRPGELARRLDHLLRISKAPDSIVELFEKVASKVSSPVLLQVLTHFKNRNNDKDIRTFFPKGNIAKVCAIDNKLPIISVALCEKIVTVCEKVLIDNFKKLPSLGKVYVDEKLKDCVVPFSQRSASKSLRTISRGSKISMPEGSTIRLFIWWRDGEKRVDLDLSSVMYDEKWNYIENISYTHVKSDKYLAHHSGDITAAPHGASEFIDLDIESMLNYGARYIVMSVLSYTEQKFIDIPDCRVGWMMRKNPNSGEIFEPKTVVDKIYITSESTICVPIIFDLKERKLIWTDVALKRDIEAYNNVENNGAVILLMGKALTSLVKPNLYDLFKLHAKARGTLVSKEERPTTVFSLKDGITPYDIDVITSKFL